MKYQAEKFSIGLFLEAMPLLERHYMEIAHFKDIPFEPDLLAYETAAQVGALRIYTSRTPFGTLAGYAVFFVRANPHYKSSVQAVQDVLYIDPRFRGRGAQFISFCDLRLKIEGVDVVYHHIKAARNFGPVLERIGYELVDLIFAKRLNKTVERKPTP